MLGAGKLEDFSEAFEKIDAEAAPAAKSSTGMKYPSRGGKGTYGGAGDETC